MENKKIVEVKEREESFSPVFSDDIEEIDIINEADVFFSDLIKQGTNYMVLDSKTKSISYFKKYIESSSKKGDYTTQDIIKIDKIYNPVFYQLFVNRLRELSKKYDVYVEVTTPYHEEKQTYFISASVMNREEFENKYGVSLDTYYDTIIKSSELSNATDAEKYRNELIALKKSYIDFLISDLNNGEDASFIELDGFQAFLMVDYKYRHLKNRNEIINELGFVIDYENHTLKLSSLIKQLK